ncbi:MAG: glycosyltransferase family 4 protein [Nitrospiria bacterium]
MKKTNTFKVGYFLKRYPRLSETFVVNEIRELQRQGIEVTVFAQKAADEKVVHEKTKILQVPIYYMPPVKWIPEQAASVKFLKTLSANPQTIGRLTLSGNLSLTNYRALIEAAMVAPFIQSLGIDLIHAHFATWAAAAAGFVSRITNIPYTFTAHAKDIYHKSVDKPDLAKKITAARFAITVSDYNKQYLEEVLKSEGTSGRIIRLYNGIDLNQFPYEESEKDPGLIVGVGRLVPKKGFEYLIKACDLLNRNGKSFRCLIIGEGEEKDRLEKWIKLFSLEKHVRLLGSRTQEALKEILKKASVFALPCIVDKDGNRDGLPTVLLEAMALGVPVVSTKVTGIPEMISHGKNGFLVEEKNAAALAKAIDRLLGSPALQKEFTKSAYDKVRKDFNITENVALLKDHFLAEEHPIRTRREASS